MVRRCVLLALALGSASISHAADSGQPTDPIPANDPSTWVDADDYPISELMKGKSGTTGFELWIDERGQVTGCKVRQTSGSVVLDATTCALTRVRAKFKPARDADGRAVRGAYSDSVRWSFPDPEPITLPQERKQVVVTLDVDKRGFVEACDYSLDRKEFAEIAALSMLCAEYPVGEQMGAVVDASGKPIAVRITVVQTAEYAPR